LWMRWMPPRRTCTTCPVSTCPSRHTMSPPSCRSTGWRCQSQGLVCGFWCPLGGAARPPTSRSSFGTASGSGCADGCSADHHPLLRDRLTLGAQRMALDRIGRGRGG
jgi:hypothetical protein